LRLKMELRELTEHLIAEPAQPSQQ